VGERRHARALRTRSSEPLTAECLALEDRGRRRFLVANLSSRTQTVSLHGGIARGRLRTLDQTTAVHAMTSPGEFRATTANAAQADDGVVEVTLRPFATACLDGELS
jgi:hypothetical protein